MPSISGDFLAHIHSLFQLSAAYLKTGRGIRVGDNGYSPYSLPAYVAGVTAIEAFLNERFLHPRARFIMVGGTVLDELSQDQLYNLEVRAKLQLLPQLAFGKTLRSGQQPFQDFSLLVTIRNAIVHFKMKGGAVPKFVQPLVDRGIALPAPDKKTDYEWMDKISTFQAVRWAHNTAAATISAVHELGPDQWRDYQRSLGGFPLISDSDVREILD